MPDLHGALALLLYPDMAAPRLCVSDETTYDAFVHALNLYRWNVEYGSASTAEKSFPIPAEPASAPAEPGPPISGDEALVKPMGRARKATGATPAKKAPGRRRPPAMPPSRP